MLLRFTYLASISFPYRGPKVRQTCTDMKSFLNYMKWYKREERIINCTICNLIGWIFDGCENVTFVTLRMMNRSLICFVKYWLRSMEDATPSFRHVHYTKFRRLHDHLFIKVYLSLHPCWACFPPQVKTALSHNSVFFIWKVNRTRVFIDSFALIHLTHQETSNRNGEVVHAI